MLPTLFSNYNTKTAEHLPNIAINFLDIDSLQSRCKHSFFSTKKRKPYTFVCIKRSRFALVILMLKVKLREP